MQDKETGGSDFPRQHTVADANDPSFKLGNEGMTLRDYFIAHAPVEPWGWFKPVMPSGTDNLLEMGFDGKCYSEKERQRFIQWPAFWADTMLKDRK